MAKKTPPALNQQNMLDKAIAYLAPGIAVQRISQRNQLAISGAYTGARIDRSQLAKWNPTNGSANSDTIRDLRVLRARSRDQMRNAPVALGALNTKVSHSVGTGLSYSPSIDADFLGLDDEQKEEWEDDTKRRFNAWAGSPDCDIARQLDFYGLQELGFRSYLESGDCFAVTPRITRSGKTRLAIQLVEADRVCNPQLGADTATMLDGIELVPETGEVLADHVARAHPGGINYTGNKWDRVAARGTQTGRRNVLHIYKPLRPGQVRGVSWIAPILEPLKQLGRWSDAELNAAVVSGLMATFVTMDANAFQDLYDEDAQGAIIDNASKWSGEMESGKAINLLPGESVESPPPGRPNPAFDPFWVAMVRQIGMALEMPYEVLVMHFQSSYSAARAALLMAWKSFRSSRDLLSKTFCQPVFELWLADEVAEGRISCPGFFTDDVVRAAWCSAIWTGDGPGSIDPEKEVNAAQKRVDLGISTKQAESIAFDGIDWQQKHEQRVKEINAEKADGIFTMPAGTALAPDQVPKEDGQPVPAPAGPDEGAAALARMQDAAHDQAIEISRLTGRVQALAEREPTINITMPPVTVNMGDTHIAPAAVTVDGHEINVNMPEGMVQLDAHIDAPAISIPPAQVVVQPPAQKAMRQVHKLDGDGNLIETITTPLV